MNRKQKRWTAIEDKYIFEKISENPHNLSKCFILIADRLGRTPCAVRYRYYEQTKTNSTICLFSTGKKSNLVNRKITREDTVINPTPTSQSIWVRILNLFR